MARATTEVVRIANSRSGEGFIAISPEARKKFWLDRKRTAAISKHTNAFKINEDVVIPLPRMAEYTDGIERINIELSLRNKIRLADELEDFFSEGNLPLGQQDDASEIPSAELLEDRVAQALALVREVRAQWQDWLAGRRHPVPAAAGPHPARQLEDADPRAAAGHLHRAAPLPPSWPSATPSTSACSRAGSGWRCTCTPATAMCTPTSRSTATTTRCCRPRTGRSSASWRWRARSTA